MRGGTEEDGGGGGGEGMEIRKLIRSRSSGLEGNWVSMLTDNATETS